MGSSTRGRIRYRCGNRKCYIHFTQKKLAKREPKCPVCGETRRIWNIEKSRRNELARQDTCQCNAYPFPHKSGSLRMCDYHLLRNEEPTEEEISYYQDCLNTPRSKFL